MSKNKIGVIVQARMGSTRLPGKILKILHEKERVIDILIKRLKLSKKLDEIIIATTPDIKNEAIIEVATEHEVKSFVGDEDNVLSRYFYAAKKFNLDVIIRITSDCPFVDPMILDDMINFFQSNNYDYVRNVDETTNFPRGFEIEIFSSKVLSEIFTEAKTKPEKEHVTYYIYTHPEKFTMFSYNIEKLKKIDNLRLTIDEEADLKMCREIYKRLIEKQKPVDFSIFDIVKIVEDSPELMEINKSVQQKKV
ncbi:MAG: glycosyltransferase family protein [Candidatus Lokiarchaeota archaeon]|nr:glycosyltransferase family protein [Candidatus Lokiarchaeota archaeon]